MHLYVFSSVGHSSDELNKDDFSDVATLLLSENSKQNHLMNGPLMKVLKRGNDDHELLRLSDLVDRPLESVNRSWERFQVSWCFRNYDLSYSLISQIFICFDPISHLDI